MVNSLKIYRILLITLLFAGHSTLSFGFNARVAGIPDGDTIEVYKEGKRFRITIDLYGIDCPEKQQYFGRDARNAMVSLVVSNEVWIDTISEDAEMIKYRKIKARRN